MSRTLAVFLCLASLVSSCHRRGARRASPAVASSRWYVRPVDGPPVRVATGLALRGAVRVDASANPMAAGAPFPAAPIVATARVTAALWLFASSDGSVYRAPSFTGALTLVASLPFRLEAPAVSANAAARGVHSEGALVVVDRTLHAHRVEVDGTHRPLGVDGVIAACARSRDELAVVSEPGVLRVSHDGGRTFAVERPPAGVALTVWNVDGEAVVRSTAGAFHWVNGALAPMPDGPAPVEWLHVPEGLTDQASTAFASAPLPLAPLRVAEAAPGTLVTVEGRSLVTRDANTGRERSREDAPGDDCTLHTAPAGLRAVCRHDAWATALFARDRGAATWTIVRDEARAEPMGAVVFDDVSNAWAVHAPCAQRPEADPQRACLYDARGAKHELRLAVGAELAALHRGEVLALRVGGGWRVSKAYVVSPTAARELDLPDRVRRVTAARWGREGVRLIASGERDAAGVEALMVVLGTHDANTWRWRTLDAPPEHLRGVFAGDGSVLAYGARADRVSRWRGGDRFVALPPAVQGNGEALTLDLDAPACCAGPWCSFGGALTLGSTGRGAPAIARRDAVPADVAEPSAQREVVCEHGAPTPAPEIDRGVAVTGHALRASVVGTALTANWFGETLRGVVSAPLPVPTRDSPVTLVRGVPNARELAGLVEYCNRDGCDHLLVRRGGITDLALGRAAPGGVEVHERANGGWLVRSDDLRDGVALVTLVAVDALGSVTARKTYALAQQVADAAAGWWQGRDGLYLRDREGAMGFYPLDAGDADGRALVTTRATGDDTAPCAPSEPEAPGEARLVHRVAQVRGTGWYVEFGEWQVEERVAVFNDRVCARVISGSEPREEPEGQSDEREPVRSFVLRAAADGRFEGRAWAGERALPLRCTRSAPR